jgi:pimeloyl-ACP methyl ester carboxylesterase
MPVANINGMNLNYEISGRGPAVVFLHGGNGRAQDWANQFQVLSPDYTTIALDIRGHGKSEGPKTEAEYSIPIIAEDVLGLLNLLRINKCCLVGHSFGGFVALQFAVTHQDRLAGLVPVDTSSGPYGGGHTKTGELTQKLVEIAVSRGMDAVSEYDAANNPERIEKFRHHPELIEPARQTMLAMSVNAYIWASRTVAKWQPVTPRLAEIKVPTLIFWGEGDKRFETAIKTLEQGIPGAVLTAIKGVGHSPHQDAPDIFNRELLKFLRRVWSERKIT